MKSLITILLLFSLTLVTQGQTVPWAVTPTTESHSVNISDASITVDNNPLETGDAIGLFYDSLGFLACGGYAVWPSAQIIAYGDDSGEPNGFSSAGLGEPFKFKIWKKRGNCVVDSGTIVQFQYLPPTFNDSIYFKVNGTSKMITLNGARKEIYYPQTHYCTGDPDPLPVKVGNIPDVTYSSQAGLSLNPTTGQINIAASQPGSYTIFFQTSLCLLQQSFEVKVKLNIDNLHTSVTKSTCTSPGQLFIDPGTVQCGTAPLEYKLKNILNGQETTSSSNVISKLPDAAYELYVKDANGDEVKYHTPVIISKDCKDLILAPNSTGESSTFFIPYEGKARIYDRFGQLTKEVTIPSEWDATDNSGNLVPMGQYVIICNEEKQIVITVIK